MRNLILILLTMVTLNSSGQNTENKPLALSNTVRHNNVVKIVRFNDLESVIEKSDNKLYVVNFWATWCKPCVMELPGFMEVNKKYQSNPHFKMILVSLDLAKEVGTEVQPFLKKNKMDVDVYLLDDNKHMNEWIQAVDKSWSGAIPATVFYRNGKKLAFKESKMDKNELEKIISKYL
ncbi:MAG: TlpA disulfide reductase family protein [Paludibacter sp.]|nr:TlpA disulfide reductase family protein [Paludibacter sp.]